VPDRSGAMVVRTAHQYRAGAHLPDGRRRARSCRPRSPSTSPSRRRSPPAGPGLRVMTDSDRIRGPPVPGLRVMTDSRLAGSRSRPDVRVTADSIGRRSRTICSSNPKFGPQRPIGAPRTEPLVTCPWRPAPPLSFATDMGAATALYCLSAVAWLHLSARRTTAARSAAAREPYRQALRAGYDFTRTDTGVRWLLAVGVIATIGFALRDGGHHRDRGCGGTQQARVTAATRAGTSCGVSEGVEILVRGIARPLTEQLKDMISVQRGLG